MQLLLAVYWPLYALSYVFIWHKNMPLFKIIASIIIAIISLCLVIISQAVKQCIIAQLPYRHTV